MHRSMIVFTATNAPAVAVMHITAPTARAVDVILSIFMGTAVFITNWLKPARHVASLPNHVRW